MTDRNDEAPEAPGLRDSERTEFQWLMARDADPSAPAPSAEVAEDYARLEHMLATLPEDTDDSWQVGLMAQVRAQPIEPAAAVTPIRPKKRRAATWLGLGGGLVAAAVAALLLIPREADFLPSAHPYKVAGAGRGDSYGVGQTLTTDDFPTSYDLRLYDPDGQLLARCPGGPSCRLAGKQNHIEQKLTMRGRYLLVWNDQLRPEFQTRRDFLEQAKSMSDDIPVD